MAERAWQDLIVGDRMQVDQAFAARVRESGFSNQEWSLVMTAVELEIQESGEGATLVADTSRVADIAPEIERIKERMGPYSAGEQGADRGGGLIDSLRSSLGLSGGSVDPETIQRAEKLAAAYAAELEAHLRENGKWEQVLANQ